MNLPIALHPELQHWLLPYSTFSTYSFLWQIHLNLVQKKKGTKLWLEFLPTSFFSDNIRYDNETPLILSKNKSIIIGT